MRKLNLASYEFSETNEPNAEVHDYDVRWSMGEVLLARDQGLTARQLLENNDLYRKLRDWPEDTILLEEAEYDALAQSFNSVTGFGKSDVEMVRRVLGAEEVEVEEKSPNGAASLAEPVTTS